MSLPQRQIEFQQSRKDRRTIRKRNFAYKIGGVPDISELLSQSLQ